jgi:hypothetical protein
MGKVRPKTGKGAIAGCIARCPTDFKPLAPANRCGPVQVGIVRHADDARIRVCPWSSDSDTSCIRMTGTRHRRIRSRSGSCATVSSMYTASVVIGVSGQASKLIILLEPRQSWPPTRLQGEKESSLQCNCHSSLMSAVHDPAGPRAARTPIYFVFGTAVHIGTINFLPRSRSVFDCARNGRSKDHISHP